MMYVNLSTNNIFVQLDFELDENYNVGTTYSDYLSGSWVKLTPEQGEFYQLNPFASVKEVFDCKLTPVYVPTLEEVKGRKIKCITQHDSSDEVNQFYISESPMWLDKEMRVGLMNSINIERSAGRTETNLWFGGVCFSFTIEQAIGMLNALELYALDCYNTTQRHIAAINALYTKEEIEAYDFTVNYPDKLNF